MGPGSKQTLPMADTPQPSATSSIEDQIRLLVPDDIQACLLFAKNALESTTFMPLVVEMA